MHVCVCNALTEQRIRDAIDAGAGSLAEVFRLCGAVAQCGTCAEAIRSLLHADRAEAGAPVDAKVSPAGVQGAAPRGSAARR